MDLLSEAVALLSPAGEIGESLELSSPWGFDGPDILGTFYVVARGICWLEPKEGEAVQLAAGDFALLPHGGSHVVRDSRSTRAVPMSELDRRGGGGAAASLIAGTIRCATPDEGPLLDSLPRLIRLESDGRSASFEAALRMFVTAVARRSAGDDAVARHLGGILFIEAARDAMANASGGWLRAVADPQVGGAMALMHARPGEEWTVDSLAAGVGISRASLAVRFHRLVGQPPLTYLTRWRMRAAARELRSTARPIREIAEAVSYQSEAAFNNVFKRVMGVTPGRYRRGARSEPPVRPRRRAVASPPRPRKPEPPKKKDWSFID